MTERLLELTKLVVISYVGNNPVPTEGLASLISGVAAAFGRLLNFTELEPVMPRSFTMIGEEAMVTSATCERISPTSIPAVNPKRSVFRNYIVSLETGEGFLSLTRHLAALGISPEQYRTKWGLPDDYPMTAPAYPQAHSKIAEKPKLDRKRKVTVALQTSQNGGSAGAVTAAAMASQKRRRPAKANNVSAGGADEFNAPPKATMREHESPRIRVRLNKISRI